VTSSVIIYDFTIERQTFLVFTDAEFEIVMEMWNRPDRILADLQSHALFAGRTTWAHLDPMHFRLLLMRNLTLSAALTPEQQADEDNATTRSLHFLLCALIHCIESRSDSSIELLRINRMGETEVTYNYDASINLAVDYPKQPRSTLRVIVDNT